MTATEFPFPVRVTEPLVGTREDGHEICIGVGTVLDVLHIEPADPSAGIYGSWVIVTDPTDIGNELTVDDMDFPVQDIGDDGQIVVIPGNVEPVQGDA